MVAKEKMPLAKATIGNRVAFAAAMMAGSGVVETARRSVAADEIRSLAKEVGRKLGV
jgi:chromosome partitioning protein